MPSAQSMALVATFLAGLSAASPVKIDAKLGRFTVPQVKGGKVLRWGPAAMAAAHLKYGAEVPEDTQRALDTQSGTVQNNPAQYDSQYTCPVTVGCSTLNLDFDTGSSDLWVFSSLLPQSAIGSHNVFNPSTCSAATVEEGASWNITYGDHSGAAGTVYSGKVVVGGVTATSQAIEAATSVSSQFTSNTANDGLLGLGFGSLNTVKPKQATTFFDNVSKSLAKPMFAVTLKHQQPGSYDFGFVDTSKYTGPMVTVPVNATPGWWRFDADGYQIGTGASVNQTLDGIADTGTTLLMLPDDIVKAYYAQVSGAKYDSLFGGYTFGCNANLPDLSIVIGGQAFVVPGSLLNFAPTTIFRFSCYGGLQSSASIGINIFGDVFLKNVYAVFQESPPTLSFAKQA